MRIWFERIKKNLFYQTLRTLFDFGSEPSTRNANQVRNANWCVDCESRQKASTSTMVQSSKLSSLMLALFSIAHSNLNFPCSFGTLPLPKRAVSPAFTAPGQYPESFDFDRTYNRFIAGSANGGGLYSVSALGGPTTLISSIPQIMGEGFMTLGSFAAITTRNRY